VDITEIEALLSGCNAMVDANVRVNGTPPRSDGERTRSWLTGETIRRSIMVSDAAAPSSRRHALTPARRRLRLASDTMSSPIGNSHFPTTRWTRVLHLLAADDLKLRKEALATLCQDYWYPLYAFARRLGRSREDAEDLTQGFFVYALEHDVFNAADRNLGTLRTFLLRVFQRYIGDVWDREHAQKRGGGKELLSLNLDGGEELYSRDLAMNDSPELLFDRSWAQTLLRAALSALAASEQNATRGQQFELFQSFLTPDAVSEQNYEAAARAAGMAPEAVRQAVCRLRKKFRECLREQIATTLQEPDDTRIDAELSALRAALRG
jgi:RNA polymerase sigma factor (sigma-70 family)